MCYFFEALQHILLCFWICLVRVFAIPMISKQRRKVFSDVRHWRRKAFWDEQENEILALARFVKSRLSHHKDPSIEIKVNNSFPPKRLPLRIFCHYLAEASLKISKFNRTFNQILLLLAKSRASLVGSLEGQLPLSAPSVSSPLTSDIFPELNACV